MKCLHKVVCEEHPAVLQLAAANARIDGLRRGLCDAVKASGGVAEDDISDAFLILGVPAEMKARREALDAANARIAELEQTVESANFAAKHHYEKLTANKAAAEAKIAELEQKLADADAVAMTCSAMATASNGAARIAELERDRARLEWLFDVLSLTDADGDNKAMALANEVMKKATGHHKTPRAAIDAAMRGTR